MRRLRSLLPLLLLLIVVAAGCADKTVKVYTANLPVYEDIELWRLGGYALEAPRPLKRPGKIYIYNDLLIVNELMEGVHIFNNANPSAPVDLGFLPIYANSDIAVRNNIMYLDSYTDILSFDISDPTHPMFVARAVDAVRFDDYTALPGYDFNLPMGRMDELGKLVVRWTQGETTEEISGHYDGPMFEDMSTTSGFTGTQMIGGVGQGGSTARFAMNDHYLYTLENFQLGVFDIASSTAITHQTDVALTRLSETIFVQDDYVYLGTTTGMSIYSLTNPSNPTFVSEFVHVTSCDPVVVQGDKAFVTLSTGRTCGGDTNTLMIIDLSNITMPAFMTGYGMTNPKGLGVDGNTLFVCDGAAGLKIYDKSDLYAIDSHLISHFPGITAADVIPRNQVLIMTSAEGIFQYSYADLGNIVQLSQIPVTH
jgi:hypothetical protein